MFDSRQTKEQIIEAATVQNERLIAALAELDDLRSANKLLHSLLTERDAEIERLRAENDVLRDGLRPYWGEYLERRLAYVLAQRIQSAHEQSKEE